MFNDFTQTLNKKYLLFKVLLTFEKNTICKFGHL